jgi:pimeloyl-ACP methyl ester carboxylesterase
LLNIALGAGSLFWPPGFLRALAAAGYRVVRYDQRGTSASNWMTDWSRKHPYSLIDMANDVVAVLDELRVDRAHVLALSLGGFVAQEVAIKYPERVRSLTLMSTSADPTDASMPGPRTWPLIRSAIANLPLLRYRLLGGETNLVKELLAGLSPRRGRTYRRRRVDSDRSLRPARTKRIQRPCPAAAPGCCRRDPLPIPSPGHDHGTHPRNTRERRRVPADRAWPPARCSHPFCMRPLAGRRWSPVPLPRHAQGDGGDHEPPRR